MNPVRSPLLHGPIAGQLLRLSWPVLVVLALQTPVGVAETWFVSFLGTDAPAGVALGLGFGALFTAGVWKWGPALFARMSGEGGALGNAVLYANFAFLSAVPGWIANLLAAALRGAGNVRVPAIVTAAGSLATLGLSPLFIFGWGPLPGLGVAGAGVALIVFNLGSMLALVLYLRSRGSPLRLARARLQARLFGDILSVGVLSAAGTVIANLSVVLTTGFVGRFGTDAIAGYGLASRLDYMLIPFLFALGTWSAGSLESLYWVVALTYVIFGGINLLGMASGFAWGRALSPEASS